MSDSENAPPMRGVFWVVDEKLLAFPFCPDHPLVPFYPEGIAKSGVTYNHEKLWNILFGKKAKPYNYYPRGRVEISSQGQSILYMSPHISAAFLPEIKKAFSLYDEPIVRLDYSKHYRCYLDTD